MKAFQVAPASKEAVEATPRKAMTPARKLAVLALQARCWWCEGSFFAGDEIEYDHRIPLELGGSDTGSNIAALHYDCHQAKTARDRKAIAKARRLRAREDGTRRPRKAIPSRSFDKCLTRSIGGKVSER